MFLLCQVRGKDGRRSDGLARSVSLDSDRPADNFYTDVPGTNLEPFFIETLSKSSQDCKFLLRLEQELTDFVNSGRFVMDWITFTTEVYNLHPRRTI